MADSTVWALALNLSTNVPITLEAHNLYTIDGRTCRPFKPSTLMKFNKHEEFGVVCADKLVKHKILSLSHDKEHLQKQLDEKRIKPPVRLSLTPLVEPMAKYKFPDEERKERKLTSTQKAATGIAKKTEQANILRRFAEQQSKEAVDESSVEPERKRRRRSHKKRSHRESHEEGENIENVESIDEDNETNDVEKTEDTDVIDTMGVKMEHDSDNSQEEIQAELEEQGAIKQTETDGSKSEVVEVTKSEDNEEKKSDTQKKHGKHKKEKIPNKEKEESTEDTNNGNGSDMLNEYITVTNEDHAYDIEEEVPESKEDKKLEEEKSDTTKKHGKHKKEKKPKKDRKRNESKERTEEPEKSNDIICNNPDHLNLVEKLEKAQEKIRTLETESKQNKMLSEIHSMLTATSSSTTVVKKTKLSRLESLPSNLVDEEEVDNSKVKVGTSRYVNRNMLPEIERSNAYFTARVEVLVDLFYGQNKRKYSVKKNATHSIENEEILSIKKILEHMKWGYSIEIEEGKIKSRIIRYLSECRTEKKSKQTGTPPPSNNAEKENPKETGNPPPCNKAEQKAVEKKKIAGNTSSSSSDSDSSSSDSSSGSSSSDEQ